MKEAFDLIRKNVQVLSGQDGREFCKRRTQEECDKYTNCTDCFIGSVLSIVSEVEAEYGNDVCEWKNEKGMFIQNPHTGRKFSNEPSMKNFYCNTCGKKIKVVGELPEAYKPTTD